MMGCYKLRLMLLVGLSTCGSVQAIGQAGTATSCDGGDPASCRYILRATEDLTGMLVTSNPAPLRRHLDPRAIWISSRGDVRSGEQLIAAVAGDSPRASASLDRANVRFFGDVAVVTWAESWTAPGRNVPAGRLAGMDTWAKIKGRWRIVATAESRLQP
jgi:hypothetical protein